MRLTPRAQRKNKLVTRIKGATYRRSVIGTEGFVIGVPSSRIGPKPRKPPVTNTRVGTGNETVEERWSTEEAVITSLGDL